MSIKFDSADQIVEGQPTVVPTTDTISADQEFDGQAPASASLAEPESTLDPRRIYSYEELTGLGYIFATMKINRPIDETIVKSKKKSIEKVGGILTPCLVVTGEKCKQDGVAYQCDTTGYDPKKILVVLDGCHRFQALKSLNMQDKCYFALPLAMKVDTPSLLREANVATTPWKGSDFLKEVIDKGNKQSMDCSMIQWIEAHTKIIGNDSSWLWGTFDLYRARAYTKAKLVKACDGSTSLDEIVNKGKFQYGKQVYDAMDSKFGQGVVKLRVVPKTFISYFESLTIDKGMSAQDAVNTLVQFVDHVTDQDVEKIKALKKTAIKTKDQLLVDEFNRLWEAYNNPQPQSTESTSTAQKATEE